MTWYKVSRSDGSTGYVAADYCSLGSGDSSAGASGTITGTEVRMRASYSTDSEVLGYFENGETVAILDDVCGRLIGIVRNLVRRGIGTLCCGRRIGVVGIVWTMRELRGELFEQCFLIHTARPP